MYAVGRVKNGKAPGPDGIPPEVVLLHLIKKKQGILPQII